MKPPTPPPPMSKAMDRLRAGDIVRLLETVSAPAVKGRYVHWDKLRYLDPPKGLSPEEWWSALKFARLAGRRALPLVDGDGKPFTYVLADPTSERLREIDMHGGGEIAGRDTIPAESRERYIVRSLMEEAIASSILEGAHTTRRVAKEMLRTGREPRNKHERMVFNNFQTMEFARDSRKETLSRELVLDIHRRVTRETLDDPDQAGRLRRTDEPVVVEDDTGEVTYTPPPAASLEARMEAMCDFANGRTPPEFVHPALRAIILHFWLAYDHPFVDGNGRTARALFYWSILHHEYWMFEFVSISPLLKKAPASYAKAFLYTESDDNDLTYFILHQLDVIRRAIADLHGYINRKTRETQRLAATLRRTRDLNHRQRALLAHALRHPNQEYTFESHRASHGVTYATARADVLALAESGYLAEHRAGRRRVFTPVDDLEKRLKRP